MGQIQIPIPPPSLILSATDRLVASNADGGLSVLASHVVLLGEHAGRNLGALTDVYAIGEQSLAGGLTNLLQSGTVVLGGNILSAFRGTNNQPQLDGPIIAIGDAIGPQIIGSASSLVLIGSRIAHDAPGLQSTFDASVVIGTQAIERQRTAQTGGGNFCRRSVVMGFRALRGTAFSVDGAGTGINESVFIGAEAGQNAGFDTQFPGGSIEGVVAIGTRALQAVNSGNGTSSSNSIAIGFECAIASRSSQRCVWIGANITTPGLDAADDVIIGALILGDHITAAGKNVVIGARASIQGLGSRCIVLGAGANGTGELGAGNDHLVIETVDSTTGVRRGLIYGNLGTATGPTITACGIAFGLSSAANRDLPGMNVVKIIAGSYTGVAPVGGGIFYYDAATGLHFVGAGGTDTVLAPP